MNMDERFPRLLTEYHPLTPFRSTDLWDEFFSTRFPMHVFSEAPSQSMKPSAWLPRIDLQSDEQKYTLKAELPGMQKDDMQITVDHGCLTLHGEHHESSENKEKGYTLHERHFGSFTRTLPLPEDALADKITANQKDGLLTIEIPREHNKAQRIAVQEA